MRRPDGTPVHRLMAARRYIASRQPPVHRLVAARRYIASRQWATNRSMRSMASMMSS
jgi:hypothetical protein